MDPNTSALLGGFQVGNQWAARRDRRKENEADNAYRSESAQNRLKEGFGEDTVYGADGKVDIVGSAAKRRLREDAQMAEAGRGAAEAWDGRPIAKPVPQVAVPRDVLGRPSEMDFEVPEGMAPVAPALVGVDGRTPWDVPLAVESPERRLPDMTGWAPARVRAFMEQYPKVRENERKTQAEIAQEANRLAIEELRAENRLSNTDKLVGGRQGVADTNADAKLEGIDRQVAGRKIAEEIKAKAKQAVLAGAEPKLNTRDKRLIDDTATSMSTKVRISQSLENQINQVDDPTLDPAVRYAVAQAMYKTINSAEGKDAVQEAEADRIGALLQFQLNPLEIIKRGQVLPSIDKFIQQVRLKVAELKLDVKDSDDFIKETYARYPGGYNPDKPGQTGTNAPAGFVLMTNPQGQSVKVPNDKVDAATKAGYK